MKLLPWRKPEIVERDESYPVPLQEYVTWLSYQGTFYPFQGLSQTIHNEREEVGAGFSGLMSAFMANSVVFSCMEVRRSHFSEVRFIYRQRVKGRAGDLFGTPDLAMLEAPYGPGSAPGDLLSRMIQDADLAGNSYHVKNGDRLARLRPDWVAVILGSRARRENWVPGDPDTQVAGYIYFPGGKASGEDAITLLPEQVAHFAPIPDPMFNFKGMSWLTPLIRDIQSDSMMTSHKSSFLTQGATPNMIVKVPPVSQEKFNEIVETIRRDHEGPANAYKTLFLAGGADATVVGANFQEADFRAVQGAGETRIAAAARTPPVIVGLSEGLQGSSLNTGNYQAARRMFADGTLRPLWRNAAGALTKVVVVPGGSELWYDDGDVAFLREDLQERANVMQSRFAAAKSGINAGFKPNAIVKAIASDDFSILLDEHTGLTSVQLVPPMEGQPAMNGKGGTAIPQPLGN